MRQPARAVPNGKGRLLIAFGALLACMTVSSAASASFFSSPTGNIRCLFTDTIPGVVCQTMNNARSVELDRYGMVQTYRDSGAPLLPGRRLGYGRSASGYGVRCVSQFSGMRCTSMGRGFVLSRSGIRIF